MRQTVLCGATVTPTKLWLQECSKTFSASRWRAQGWRTRSGRYSLSRVNHLKLGGAEFGARLRQVDQGLLDSADVIYGRITQGEKAMGL